MFVSVILVSPEFYSTLIDNQFGGFQGGPGGSSLFGLFIEHGPFSVDANLNLVERNHTWTATHSVLYVDNPVGTGFSFTEKDACYATDQNQVWVKIVTISDSHSI